MRLAIASEQLHKYGFSLWVLGNNQYFLMHSELEQTYYLTGQQVIIFEASLSAMVDNGQVI
jgi:hypothetical protein